MISSAAIAHLFTSTEVRELEAVLAAAITHGLNLFTAFACTKFKLKYRIIEIKHNKYVILLKYTIKVKLLETLCFFEDG